MSAQDNARLIQTLLEAFNAKDTGPHAAMSTDDFEVLDVPSGMTLRGPDGHRQLVQSWMTAFPDGQVQATSLFTTEDQGHLEYIGRGTNTGPFPYSSGQIAPTGRQVEFRVSAGLQFREGKVASIHYYYDLLTVLQQLGLVPTKEGTLVPIS
jgi:ketosteroid isomerase-like protein